MHNKAFRLNGTSKFERNVGESIKDSNLGTIQRPRVIPLDNLEIQTMVCVLFFKQSTRAPHHS